MGIRPDIYESCLLKGKDGKPLAPEYMAACSWASDVLSHTQKEDTHVNFLFSKTLHKIQHPASPDFAVFMRNIMEY